jgi:hypothetical protein
MPPFAKDCLQQQLPWIHTSVAFCLGEGKNFDWLNKFNNDFHVFHKIVPLPHPRFIMQYKLKTKEDYIKRYGEEFKKVTD